MSIHLDIHGRAQIRVSARMEMYFERDSRDICYRHKTNPAAHVHAWGNKFSNAFCSQFIMSMAYS